MNRPSVLVLLASYNGEKWISEQIKSILGQVDVDVTLVVGDDSSTDATKERVANSFESDRVRIASATSRTGSAAQNFFRLIRQTPIDGHEYVAFSDQDDIWLSGKLARGCSAIKSTESHAYSCAVTAFWDNDKETVLTQGCGITHSDFLFEGAGQGCTYILAKDTYSALRDFLSKHAEQIEGIHFHDWLIYALARSWNLRWYFDQTPMLRYRQHGLNDIGARSGLAARRNRLRLIRSGWYLRQITMIGRTCLVAAPTNEAVVRWNNILSTPRGFFRRLRTVLFCVKGGRRKPFDNAILTFSAIAGWI